MFDGLDRKIHVEVRPIQMMRARQFHTCNGRDGRVPEPGEIAKCDKQLALGYEQPESMR